MKKQNPKLLKKLSAYSALAAPIIAAASAANGQVIHTDISPDVTVTKNNFAYGLDLNGDDTIDYVIVLVDTIQKEGSPPKPFSFHIVLANPYNNNSIAASSSKGANATYVYPFALRAGDEIGATRIWNPAQSQTMGSFQGYTATGGYKFGNWVGVTDSYLGLRFYKGGQAYYGWARLDVTASKTSVFFTIKDYAYEATHDASITAGDTGTANVGIHEIVKNSAMIFAFEKNVYISSPSSAKGAMIIRVINMAGQQVRFYTTDQNQYHFSFTDLPDGFYLITAEQDGLMQTKKISLR